MSPKFGAKRCRLCWRRYQRNLSIVFVKNGTIGTFAWQQASVAGREPMSDKMMTDLQSRLMAENDAFFINIVQFIGMLRRTGLSISLEQTMDVCRAARTD